ncbi:hypothetical protein B0H14DRAFT_3452310 [Mycena olivaceomarginata]|nr:hypothetical protein B0H14DRAFT_3452310 [Mycena olivaceomarginata]
MPAIDEPRVVLEEEALTLGSVEYANSYTLEHTSSRMPSLGFSSSTGALVLASIMASLDFALVSVILWTFTTTLLDSSSVGDGALCHRLHLDSFSNLQKCGTHMACRLKSATTPAITQAASILDTHSQLHAHAQRPQTCQTQAYSYTVTPQQGFYSGHVHSPAEAPSAVHRQIASMSALIHSPPTSRAQLLPTTSDMALRIHIAGVLAVKSAKQLALSKRWI